MPLMMATSEFGLGRREFSSTVLPALSQYRVFKTEKMQK